MVAGIVATLASVLVYAGLALIAADLIFVSDRGRLIRLLIAGAGLVGAGLLLVIVAWGISIGDGEGVAPT